MEAPVRARPGGKLGAALRRFDRGRGGVEIGGGEPRDRQADGEGLESRAHLAELRRVARAQLRHEETTARRERHKSLRLEAAQRLPHGDVADAVLGGDAILVMRVPAASDPERMAARSTSAMAR